MRLKRTATDSGPSPSATSVAAPARSSASSSKFPCPGSFTATIATAISMAIAAAHARVRMPSRTQIAPTVSIVMRMTAKIVAKGKPMPASMCAVAPIPRSNLAIPWSSNTPPTARRMMKAAYGANAFTRSPLEHGHREERPQIVVRHAQPGGQEPHDGPQHLVGDVAIEVEQQLEIGSRNRDQGTGGVGDRVGGALGA